MVCPFEERWQNKVLGAVTDRKNSSQLGYLEVTTGT